MLYHLFDYLKTAGIKVPGGGLFQFITFRILLLANLNTAYIRLMIFSTLWMGMIGFIDDYLKLRAKKIAQTQGIQYKKGDKDGLAGWFKVLGQVVLGFVAAATLYFNSNTKVWRRRQNLKPPGREL